MIRHDKIVPGVILITIGVVFLLKSFGLVQIHWFNFLYLWPIFLLIGGINLIFAHNRSPLASALKVGVVMLGLCVVLFGNFGNRYHFWPRYTYHYSDDDNNNDTTDTEDNDGDSTHAEVVKIDGNSTFNQQFDANVKFAKLKISGGGTSYHLSDTTNQLFQAFTKETVGSYQLLRRTEDSVYVLDFKMKDGSNFNWDDDKGNTVTFKLNSAPIWDIDMNAGAVDLNFDLSKFKVRNFKLHGGAASFGVKLGEPLAETTVDVSTGASGVDISVPKDAACKISSHSGLSSTDFDGFKKASDGTYVTPDFDTAKNKIIIKLKGGLTGFSVKRY